VDNCSRAPTDRRDAGLAVPPTTTPSGPELRTELHRVVASLGQNLESSCDGRRERLSKITCLGGVSLLHLIEQQFPCFIVGFNVSLLTLSQLERFGRVAQSLASHRTANLLKCTMRALELALDGVQFQPYASLNLLSGINFIFRNIPLGYR
jgi:hypothetical protein